MAVRIKGRVVAFVAVVVLVVLAVGSAGWADARGAVAAQKVDKSAVLKVGAHSSASSAYSIAL
jgi:hypothetical protein